MLLDEEGRAAGLTSVDALSEEDSCPEATDVHGEAGIGLRADCWARDAWLANVLNGFVQDFKIVISYKLIAEQGRLNVNIVIYWLISIRESISKTHWQRVCCLSTISGCKVIKSSLI